MVRRTAAKPIALPVLHRVLVCRVPSVALARLHGDRQPLAEAAHHALRDGLAAPRTAPSAERQHAPANDETYAGLRPVAVPLSIREGLAVARLADQKFGGDFHAAGGWLIARGLGLAPPLPTRVAPPPVARSVRHTTTTRKPAAATATRRRRPARPRGLRLVPEGRQLRALREGLGLSQEALARRARLSRSMVGEVERGERAEETARLRMAEVLAALGQRKGLLPSEAAASPPPERAAAA